MAEIGVDIKQAQKLLEQGKLVAIPTETVYGLAANGFDEMAISQVFAVKNRPSFDPLILHTNSTEAIEKFAGPLPSKAKSLAAHFWPGPLTMVLPKKAIVPYIVTSGLETVAVRIPQHPVTLQLLKNLAFPLAAPSANPFGFVSPTSAKHVDQYLGNDIDYILNGGKCDIGLESTIISFENDTPIILRKGGLSIESIEDVIGEVSIKTNSSSKPAAPGMLSKHYSPGIPLVLGNLKELIEKNRNKRYGVLSFSEPYPASEPVLLKILSAHKDLTEAARNLFAYLREFTELAPEIILGEFLPEKGLGIAINDRLRRAAAS